MANITMSTDLWADGLTSIIAQSSEASGFETESVLAGPTNLVWRTTSDTSEYIAGDLGQTRDIDFASILGHNFRDDATLTARLRVGVDPTFVTNLYDVTLDEDDVLGADVDDTPFPTVMNFWMGSTITARYWRIDIDQTANPDTYLEIGRFLIGLKFRPEVNFDYGYKMSIKDASRVSRTHSNIMRVDSKPKTRSVAAVLSHVTLAEEVLFNKLSVGQECFISAYAEAGTGYEELEQQHTILGLLAQDIGPTRGHAKDRTFQVSVAEGSVLGGTGTSYTGSGGAANQIWLKAANNLDDLDDLETAQDNLEYEKEFSRPNLLDNGDMSLWERGVTSASGLTGSGTFTQYADRWGGAFAQLASETYSVDRTAKLDINDRGLGAVYGIEVSTTGDTDRMGITQETWWEDILDLISSREVTLSFYASANTAVVLDSIDIRTRFGSDPTETFEFADLSIPGGHILTYYESTITIGELLTQARGSTPTTKLFLAMDADDTWDAVRFYGVKLEVGRNATRWDHPNHAENLERCRRYYQYGAATTLRNGLLYFGDVTDTNTYHAQAQFPTPMVKVPTIVGTHSSASSFPAATGTITGGTHGLEESRTANATAAAAHFRTDWTADVGW